MKSALQTLPRRGCTWSERVQPRSVYKHDKSTSLCATDMSVKPAGVMACINLVPAFSLCFVFVYVSYVLFGGLGFYIPVICFFLLSLVIWSVVSWMYVYVNIWMSECVYVCAYVLYVYLSVCFTLIHSLWKPHASI